MSQANNNNLWELGPGPELKVGQGSNRYIATRVSL